MENYYCKKPIPVAAMQFIVENWEQLRDFVGKDILQEVPYKDDSGQYTLAIPTLEGIMIAREGDYIIRGVRGEFYPCAQDIFEETYEFCKEKSIATPAWNRPLYENYTALEVVEALHASVKELYELKCSIGKTEIRSDLRAERIRFKIRGMLLSEFYMEMLQQFSKVFGHREEEKEAIE